MRGRGMAKSILIFSDGTGQGAGLPEERNSNVRKLWSATTDDATQIKFYDDGLGSSAGWWRWGYNLIGKATGLGISQNIKDCYAYLIETYQPGDRIFLFGFSRGAYTVRSLGGVLSLCGIPTRDAEGRDPRLSTEARHALSEHAVEQVYKVYGNDSATREKRKTLGRNYKASFAANEVAPYFIGVWDTVRALGLPGSTGLVLWRHAFHDHELSAAVPYARHAMSIDENRATFEVVPWTATPQDVTSGRIRQVWFPGVHSDIGGGYAEAGLSDIALRWMVSEAEAIPHPIRIDHSRLNLKPDPIGMQHDERSGSLFNRIWREGYRRVPENAELSDDTDLRFKAPTVPTPFGRWSYRPRALRLHHSYKAYYG